MYYVYTHICTHMYIYLYVYIYMYMHLSLSIYIYIDIDIDSRIGAGAMTLAKKLHDVPCFCAGGSMEIPMGNWEVGLWQFGLTVGCF